MLIIDQINLTASLIEIEVGVNLVNAEYNGTRCYFNELDWDELNATYKT